MKFENDKEKVVYYWERAKYCKNKGDEKGYLYYLKKANEIKEKIENDSSKER